ncbi:MAG: glutamine--fructose-6-phosphate transaminase (isomerizing) [Clostridiales bacterium]|jgi:glucosamine--fructose-6-phosphate aminotransferase (isomerizing)|nr:glutamine--fructose-6-phosphate transaminase (isomerizing) [Clostridiales bacterium]
MCGIVGYTGFQNATEILMSGLKKLEYRGYDSAGIALLTDNINTIKSQGRVENLKNILDKKQNNDSKIGIAHTRWATHGNPSDYNSHPHSSHDCKICLVHNGIVENYLDLKNKELSDLSEDCIKSQTDTEILVHLIRKFYDVNREISEESFLDSIIMSLNKVKGSYALAIICDDFKDKIFVARKDNPLVIGSGNKENFLASDSTAILNYTREIYFLEENKIAIISPNEINTYDFNKKNVNKKIFHIDWNIEDVDKTGYDSFMLKEIFEQPKVIDNFLNINLNSDFLKNIGLEKKYLKKINHIYIIGCGTAYHAGLMILNLFRNIEGLSASCEFASEFRYENPVIDKNKLVIIISQSGETADSLAALRLAKKSKAKVLAVVNSVGSSISREADYVIYTNAGPEIAVASTKAFTAQVLALYVLYLNIKKILAKENDGKCKEFELIEKDLKNLSRNIRSALKQNNKIKKVAKKYSNSKNMFYIGRNLDYIIALEGSLKLKEIAYLFSQAYAAGELKHGPIALIDENILTIGIVTQDKIRGKTLSNLKECKARNGIIFLIIPEKFLDDEILEMADDIILIKDMHEILLPILANVVLQLFAYHVANILERDIDKPKNLAKSVTVE